MKEDTTPSCLVTRREALIAGSTGLAFVLLGELFRDRVLAADADRKVRFAAYPRRKIGRLSELRAGKPVEIVYPREADAHSIGFLVKLGETAGGGIGPSGDVVAFNALCPHQGGLLRDSYDDRWKLAGPCPIHLTTFDLTRHGMVVSGHSTSELPQIVLETTGDDIYAHGMIGLIYGHASNIARA